MCGFLVLIHDGGVVAAEMPEWLRVGGTGRSYYVLICRANGKTWLGREHLHTSHPRAFLIRNTHFHPCAAWPPC